MYKIEIEGTAENLQRISIFLEHNHIKHNIVDNVDCGQTLEEIDQVIDWPF